MNILKLSANKLQLGLELLPTIRFYALIPSEKSTNQTNADLTTQWKISSDRQLNIKYATAS